MAKELVCAECSRSIDPNDEYMITKTSKKGDVEGVLCPQCQVKFQDALEQETQAPNMQLALVAGLVGAAVAGFIWYYFVTLTEIQFGLVSVLMGWLVGKCVVWGAGNKRGTTLQWMSLSLTVVAIIFSEYLILNHYFIEEFGIGNLTASDFITVYRYYLTQESGFFDLIFFAIALWQAYTTPRKREMGGIAMNEPAS